MTREEKRAWQRAWYTANKDRINAKRRQAYAEDPEKVRSEVREWRAQNPERVRAISKRNWEKQRDAHIARQREYYRRNRDVLLAALREKNEGRGRELHERRLARWQANPELREKAMIRAKRWLQAHPDKVALAHAKRLLAAQTGLRFADIPDDIAELKLAQLQIHRWLTKQSADGQ